LGAWLGSLSACPKTHGTIRFGRSGGFSCRFYTYTLQRTIPSVRRPFTSPSPHHNTCQYMNINMLSIGFSFRIHLRVRLTLIRLALIRKPWSFGVRVSRPHYRYLCLHLLFQPLQHILRHIFSATGMLPYLLIIHQDHSFGNMFNARLLSMPDRSTSELLRTL